MTGVLAGAVGLVAGLVVGALGAGGGMLAVPALIYLLGQDPRSATTGSVVVVGAVATAGVVARVRARTVDWRTGLVFGLAGTPTAWAGALLNRTVPEPVLLLSFAALILLAATFLLLRGRAPEPETPGPGPADPAGRARRVRWAKAVAVGAVVGLLAGFFGVGGGFLVVPALTIMLGLPMPVAVGTSLLVIALNSGVSLAARLGHVSLDWAVLGPFVLVAVVAALVGSAIAGRMSATGLQRAFAVFLLAVGTFLAVRTLLDLGVV